MPPIAVAGKLVVTPQAKLESDLSDFDIRTVNALPVVTFSSKEGDFGAGRITLSGCREGTASVIVSSTNIRVVRKRATVLIVR